MDDEASTDEPDAVGSGTPDAAAEAPESDPGSASDSASKASAASAPVVAPKPAAEQPKAEEPADNERTAVFRAFQPAKPKPAVEQPKAEEPADSERTAVFRAFKTDSVSAPAAEPSKPAAAKPVADEPADNERTAVFRAVKPASASAPVPAAGSKPAAAAEKPADNERTAVFRAVKPGSASAPVPAAGSKPAAAAEKPADSERTAVFRVPKVDAAETEAPKPAPAKPAAARPTLAKPTAAGPAAKPAEAKPTAAKPTAETPKGSTFVPLRPEGSAPTATPTATPTSAPAQRPKVPVPPAAARLDHSERTTQQPLPPKPPLDMLADLTNNPPPPPSPMRTAIRRVKIYAPLVALLVVILAVVQLVRPLPEPKLVKTGKSSYTFEGAKPQLPWPTEGQAYMAAAGLGTLGQSGEQKPVPIASVTKSMTAYIILRDHPIKKGEQGAMIDVDKTAETEGKKNNSTDNESTLDTVKEGDKISEYDAIAALMIPSANNIARLLARWDSGSQEAFVKKMNDTAKELGMTNTTYTDPSGLDATTVSTAEDQVKLGLKLVEIETLLDITKKPNWVDPSGKNWRNWNGLTGPTGALGIKTGTTTKAGGNLLFAAQKKVGNTNQLIVGAVLGQHKPAIIDTVLAASKELMLATQKALDGATVVKKGQVVGYVDDGLGGRTPVVATADVQAVGWASLTVDIKLADGGGKLPQTAKAGTEVGVLTVGEGASQVKVPVALKSELAAPGIGSKLTRVG
ncbi:D-alanyl-D-alanine carboxypeptidase family protein [Streptomyces sp. NPDC058682]|uniref:D-alanyl-D-alanine carboxypeptidase family protein n=1 Tax=Streptomyces sp. NPDC058682 TaxID=3346596 RepID=UPI00365160FC